MKKVIVSLFFLIYVSVSMGQPPLDTLFLCEHLVNYKGNTDDLELTLFVDELDGIQVGSIEGKNLEFDVVVLFDTIAEIMQGDTIIFKYGEVSTFNIFYSGFGKNDTIFELYRLDGSVEAENILGNYPALAHSLDIIEHRLEALSYYAYPAWKFTEMGCRPRSWIRVKCISPSYSSH